MLETIFREGPITRPEIAAVTGLSKPTVSSAVSRLEHAGLVHAAGPRHGQRGRKPVAYVVSDGAGFVVGADIGGTNMRVAAADLFGESICDCQQPTTKEGSRAVGVQLLEMITDVIDRAGDNPRALAGVGHLRPRGSRSGERAGHLARLQRHSGGRV